MRTHAQALFLPGTGFDELGDRLIRFGRALQDPNTTIGELLQLAKACGITPNLRVTAESGAKPHE